MRDASSINFKKLLISATLMAAFLLALTSIVPSIADSLKNNSNSESGFALDTIKTAKWDEGSTSKGQIEIKADVTGQKSEDIDVLFIGTCCSVHGLEQSTIKASLDSIQTYADVDWFLFNNGSNYETDDVKGHLFKGGTQFDITKDMHDLHQGNHQALRKFFKTIHEQDAKLRTEKNKPYDFIVLEFDGSRIADYYRNLLPEDEISGSTETHDGNYAKYEYESDTATLLKEYYHANKVIWITDQAIDEYSHKDGYWPSKKMRCHDDSVHILRDINYNSLKALVAPDLYNPITNEPASFDHDAYLRIEAELKAISGFTEPVPEEYVLGHDRQIAYSDSSTVGTKISQAIQTLDEYMVVIEDYVNIKDNLRISENGVTAYVSETGEEGSWTKISEGLEVDTTTGHVKLATKKFVGDRHFKLLINFEDKSSTSRFIDVSEDGDPNNGFADIKVVPTVDGETKTIHNEEETKLPLDWDIPIYYVVEDAFKDTPVSVNNPEEIISTSATSKPNGSEAQETNNIKFQYWSTDIDGVDTYVSNQFEYVPKPDPITNRYKTATYIAHFAKSPEETKHLIVQKLWSDGDDFHLDDIVTVNLYCKEQTGKEAKLASNIQLSKDNNWTYTTEYEYQIYDVDGMTPLQYYFLEDEVEGYSASYSIDSRDPKTSGNTVITNTLIPGPGPQPTPTPTPDPGIVTPDGHSPVKTSDFTDFMALIVVAGVALSFVFIISRVQARKNKERG